MTSGRYATPWRANFARRASRSASRRRARQAWLRLASGVPTLCSSALDAEDDQIRGLEAGADDYVSKTASPALLEARIRKALERADRFSKMDAPAAMTKTEADIYRLLESDRGKVFSYREIFSAVCGEGYFADEGAIRVQVSNRRTKLTAGASLVAKRGVGYALVHGHPPTTR